MLKEKQIYAPNGFAVLGACIVVILVGAGLLIHAVVGESVVQMLVGVAIMAPAVFAACGLFMVQPNQAVVLTLFGAYRGTVKQSGLRWANPLYWKQKVSLRVRNFETGKLKVNDHAGNPIEIAAVVVWKVVDSAEASFEVDDYVNFVHVQSEAALRNLATRYDYDAHGHDDMALRSHTDEIAQKLRSEIQQRLDQAGVTVIEARFSHLAYAPEIAGAMLRRQQAAAVIAARQKIVEGAVGMVEMALDLLNKNGVVKLDEDRKA